VVVFDVCVVSICVLVSLATGVNAVSKGCEFFLQAHDDPNLQVATGIAQEMAEREARPKHSWTFDYLLKADASNVGRCLSITVVKCL